MNFLKRHSDGQSFPVDKSGVAAGEFKSAAMGDAARHSVVAHSAIGSPQLLKCDNCGEAYYIASYQDPRGSECPNCHAVKGGGAKGSGRIMGRKKIEDAKIDELRPIEAQHEKASEIWERLGTAARRDLVERAGSVYGYTRDYVPSRYKDLDDDMKSAILRYLRQQGILPLSIF